jgi:cysteine desulfurase/selenocysteine lyase
MLEVEKIREDFVILNSPKKPIYFDNACMSLKPKSVLFAMQEYYEKYPACAGRSAHSLSSKVTAKIKEARQEIAEFINAKNENEIIFTRNTTEGINLLAHGLNWQKGDIVLLSDKEHNSNLIPWLRLKKEKEIELRIVPSREDNTFDLEEFQKMVSGVKLVSIVHTSNLDGVTNPALEIIQLAHEAGALVFLDVAQSIAHQSIDVRILDVDFLAFSGHKILGPTGTGIFYGKMNLLTELKPFMVGGDTVEFSTYTDYKMLPVPQKFEAGLQDYAGIIGLAEAIKFLKRIGYSFIQNQEKELNTYITNELLKIPQIKIIGPVDASLRSGIIDFYLEEMEVHQLAIMLDQMEGICIRSGQHCVHSWFQNRKIKNSARVSLYFYNTQAEAEMFISSLRKIMKIVS